jgi:hypothetical protein
MFSFEGFSCSLDISKLQFLNKKRYEKGFAVFFFLQFLVMKTLDRIESGSVSGFTWNAAESVSGLK